jgi:hypothetical protein
MTKYFELRYLFDFVMPLYAITGVVLIALILIVCVRIARAWRKRQDRMSEQYWEGDEHEQIH